MGIAESKRLKMRVNIRRMDLPANETVGKAGWVEFLPLSGAGC
jgi:hypothetical protein